MKTDRRPSDILVFLAIIVELVIVVLSTCWTLVVGSLVWVFSRKRRAETRKRYDEYLSEFDLDEYV